VIPQEKLNQIGLAFFQEVTADNFLAVLSGDSANGSKVIAR